MKLLNRLLRKKKAPSTDPWWKGSKHQGVRWLCVMFRVERADLIRYARPFRNHESKATKKGHIHKHRSPGSKLLKRYDRARWDLLTAGASL